MLKGTSNSGQVAMRAMEAPKGAVVSTSYRRFWLALFLFLAAPLLFALSAVAFVDPYFLIGSPSWRGINVARPAYEPYVIVAKPYQVWRMRPDAVALGSSTTEMGIDPRHPGWRGRAFNFALPASTSYEILLAFLHAQSAGARQFVVGLDFFGFNVLFPRERGVLEARMGGGDGVAAFADYLADKPRVPRPSQAEPVWSESLYLAMNPAVTLSLARKEFASGRDHYERAGRGEGLASGWVPAGWNDAQYLKMYPDVAAQVKPGGFVSGYHHYVANGRAEGREAALAPPDWHETEYLQVNPDVDFEISGGSFASGYHHYVAAGRAEGRLGGFIPADWDEAGYLSANTAARARVAFGEFDSGYAHYVAIGRKQEIGRTRFRFAELRALLFSSQALADAWATVTDQSDGRPTFDDLGMRPSSEQDLAAVGGIGKMVRVRLSGGGWGPWITRPRLAYCFGKRYSRTTMFDPYRFMLRRAYAAGNDVRLFVPPLPAVALALLYELGLDTHYEFWLRNLVRINEEEAQAASKPPYPLWSFGDVNAITMEHVPAASDARPMQWFFDHLHYRKATGDLMLDRIFEQAPHDGFGVRLTSAMLPSYLRKLRADLPAWASDPANTDLAPPILTAAKALPRAKLLAKADCW